jgi:lipoprotein-anchoring transpeptidase ErfK/SrfK
VPRSPRFSGPISRLASSVALIASISTCAVLAASASARPAARAAAATSGVVAMSNESTTTYWANPLTNAAIRSGPSVHDRTLTHLHEFTEDGFPEVYIILARQTAGGIVWAHIDYPARPNGSNGWVPMDDLEIPQLNTEHLVIDLGAERATLYRRGAVIFSAPVGIGSPAAPTPKGTFWVREKFGVANDSAYGPYAFGTSAYSSLTDWPGGGVVGIHGTDQPTLIPGNPSHGCVRLRNSDISRLYGLMSVGTPVSIVG